MVWDRRRRQEAILREKIATIVLERLNDPRVGFVTITSAELSSDKRIVRVGFTVLGNEAQRRTTERALARAAPRVVEQLAPTLKMRMLPEVRFVYDEVVQKESRLLDLINSLDIQPDPVEGEGEGDDKGEGDDEGDDAPLLDAEADGPAQAKRSSDADAEADDETQRD